MELRGRITLNLARKIIAHLERSQIHNNVKQKLVNFDTVIIKLIDKQTISLNNR